MRIDASTPAAAPTGNPIGLAASRDEFLRLFVAQLQNQNPLDPQSGADMVAQLAQFSGVEQQVETNRRLQELTAAQDAAGSAGLANLVGRTVTVDATQFATDGRGPTPPITLDGVAAGGEVVVRDGNGATIATAPIIPGPPATVAWDGLTRDGAPLPAGTYTVEVAATDGSGAAVTARPQFTATVDAVAFTADGQRLHLGHVRVSPGAVTTIANGGTSP
jgi:flagellar basal-body rod modification protein FlgD